jgi:hypothetical protein
MVPYSQDNIIMAILHFNLENNVEMTELNTIALPVRCFIKVPVVKFETNGGNSIDNIDVFK